MTRTLLNNILKVEMVFVKLEQKMINLVKNQEIKLQ